MEDQGRSGGEGTYTHHKNIIHAHVYIGAQIATGVSLFDSYGMLAAFGAGLDFCVGAGVRRLSVDHSLFVKGSNLCIDHDSSLPNMDRPWCTRAWPSTSTAGPSSRYVCAVSGRKEMRGLKRRREAERTVHLLLYRRSCVHIRPISPLTSSHLFNPVCIQIRT